MPLFLRRRIYQWAREQLPARIEDLVEDFGDDMDELVDLKESLDVGVARKDLLGDSLQFLDVHELAAEFRGLLDL